MDNSIDFEITNGLSKLEIVEIDRNEFVGDYISFNYPFCINWYLGWGSVEQLIALIPCDPEYRSILTTEICETLNAPLQFAINELYKKIEPLFILFSPGKYRLKLKEIDASDIFKNDIGWSVHILPTTNLKGVTNNSETFEDYSKRYDDKSLRLSYSFDEYLNGECYVGTKPKEFIDENRVKYYEDRINHGGNSIPFIFRTSNSAKYIIDGHHKLLAYEKLKKKPIVLEICQIEKNFNENKFDISEMKKHLHPEQFKDIQNRLLHEWY